MFVECGLIFSCKNRDDPEIPYLHASSPVPSKRRRMCVFNTHWIDLSTVFLC